MMNNAILHDLINNGFDFLEKSINEFRDEPKHSTVNFCIAVELLLKSRLVHEHWSLIIKDKHPDLKKFKEGEFKSLNFQDLIPRIESVTSQVFNKEAKEYFRKLAQHRNKIIHFIHTAHTGDNLEAQKEIAEEQINGWLHLKELLLEYWQEIFAEDYSDRIKKISVRMEKEVEHLEKTNELSPSRLNNLAIYHYKNAQYKKAELLYLQALKIIKQTLGESHPDYAISLNNLAELYQAQGLYDKAELLYLQALEIIKQTLGESHPGYATSLNNLAELYRAQGLYDKAEPLFKKALEIRKQTLGESHPDYATSLNNLAELYRAQGLYDKAEPLYVQAIKTLEATLGVDHRNTQKVKENYGIFKQSH